MKKKETMQKFLGKLSSPFTADFSEVAGLYGA